MKLNKQVAIVTGASRGIGKAIATALLKEGATVILSSRKIEGLETAAAELRAGNNGPGTVHPVPLHVGRTNQHEKFIKDVTEKYGLPSILVNNAATNPYFGPLLELEWSAFDKTVEVNLKGMLGLSTALVKQQFAEHTRMSQYALSIINISSIFGLGAAPLQGAYAMTKAAMISLTQTMAHEWGASGIRVNAVAPGLVDTRFASAIVSNPTLAGAFTNRSALGRIGKPEDISGIVCYLAGAESRFVSGQTFIVDGGYVVG